MKQAFLSVSDKTYLLELATVLLKFNISLLASDGTANFLTDHDLPVVAISDALQLKPLIGGRVKTLHPTLYASILADRNNSKHCEDVHHLEQSIGWIDFVIVDLYPFAAHFGEYDSALENIDIGGVTLIRAAAKNHQYCTVICQKQDYEGLYQELQLHNGSTSLAFRQQMAVAAFAHTSVYDATIMQWLSGESYIQHTWSQTLELAYGENPQQKAQFYNRLTEKPAFKLLQGKPLSYNNILDLDAGINLSNQFNSPVATVIKHNNPCGVSLGVTAKDALAKALAADAKSAFGGIVVLNQTLECAHAEFLVKPFFEVIAAPRVQQEALALLSKKPKLRVVQYNNITNDYEMKTVLGGMLVQTVDKTVLTPDNFTVPTLCKPSELATQDLIFAAQVAKYAKSNAIVIAAHGVSLSIAAGQTSRVGAVELALSKLSNQSLAEAVLASDGFFPFSDSIEAIARAGIKAIIQPGGSIRDAEIIAACDTFGVSMVLSGVRNFKH